jgi:hypothetical protein
MRRTEAELTDTAGEHEAAGGREDDGGLATAPLGQ